MTLQELIYFREIAKTSSFKQAADNLFVSQSTLSYAIQMLERELNAPLFIRKKGRGVMLSDYGEAFLPYVEDGLDRLKKGRERLEMLTAPNKGMVRITYSFINGSVEIPNLFRSFYEEEDNGEIQLQSLVHHVGRAPIEENLISGDADVAFSCYTYSENESIIAEKIYEQQLYVVLPAAHRLAGSDGLTIQDIKDDPLIMINGTINLYGHIQDLYAAEGIVPKMMDSLSDWTGQMDLIACGRGVGILPQLSIVSANTVFVPLCHPGGKRNVYLLRDKTRKMSPSVETFWDFCRDYFAKIKN